MRSGYFGVVVAGFELEAPGVAGRVAGRGVALGAEGVLAGAATPDCAL